ncbi:MAG: TonB-linked SusC/RagA family outer membrane protein [Paraglaciecola sp.]|jgi:TonB-linked SusC/RagA family outer membrane protein
MKKILYTLFVIAAFTTAPNLLWAQRVMNGTITDAENGDPLIGANVLAEGTPVGTIADIDGKYSLEVPKESTRIIFSYTGYADQTIELGASNVLDIQMSAGALLEEVIVIGYGTVKRDDVTGSIQTVDTKLFNKGSITSAQDLLAGKVAGVQITSNNGAPGEGSTIRIRGGSSLSASNDPLIVVDGVPLDNGGVAGSRNALNFINPNDIETFTILKDASATAIYGSRASNGVILITTKKGNLGKKITVNYVGDVSFSNNIEQVEVFNADEFRNFVAEQSPAADSLLGSANTNWQDEIYQTAVGQNHNLTLSGGIANVLPYRLSLGFTDKKGILKTDEFKRQTVALNLSPKFLDNKLQVNLNTKFMNIDNRFANRGAIGSAISFDPTQTPLDSDNAYGGYTTFINAAGLPNTLAPANPLALLNLTDDRATIKRYVVNGTIDYRFGFLPELRANLSLGYDHTKGAGTKNEPQNASFVYNELTGGGTDNEYVETKKNELLEFYLNYVKELGDTKLDVMGGYSWQRFFFEKNELNSDVNNTPELTFPKADAGELYLLSLFGRVNYSIMDKYLFTVTLRRDGSSRFSPDARWGLFPAAAFAWKIIDKPMDNNPLNSLKLRLGYGVTGQQDIGSYYEYLSQYVSSINGASYQFGDDFVTTIRPNGYDANIKWEETTTYNVGVDYGIFKDRITGSIELYLRKTKDLLNFIPVAAGTNLTNFINTNVGDLENKGIEFSINAVPVKKDKMTWDIGFNVTRNSNKITKLTATDDPGYQGVLTGGISGGVGNTIQIHSVGYAANSYYVYEQVYDDAGSPIEGLYVDQNDDGTINEQDRYRFENPAPEYFFGLTTSFSYDNLTFSMAARSNLGNYVYNNLQSDQSAFSRLYQPTGYYQNGLTDVQEIGFENQQYLSDHFIQEGSFLRIDYVSLSYRLDDLLKNKLGLTVSATVQNPLLITNYSGIDPEINSGIDGNIYPRTRTFVLGVNAQF